MLARGIWRFSQLSLDENSRCTDVLFVVDSLLLDIAIDQHLKPRPPCQLQQLLCNEHTSHHTAVESCVTNDNFYFMTLMTLYQTKFTVVTLYQTCFPPPLISMGTFLSPIKKHALNRE